MSTTTHRIALTDAAYTNVSNGNLNCSLVVNDNQSLMIHIGGQEPGADTAECARVDGPGSGRSSVITASNLVDETDLWVRSRTGETDVTVIRGPSVLMIS